MTDAFAARAAQWDANPVRAAIGQAFYAQVAEAVDKHLGGTLAGRTVLEFGCGTGVLGLRLAQDHAARLLFVDTSPAMLDVLRGKLAEADVRSAQVFEGDLNAQPIPEASVDLAVSLMALHHVEDAAGALSRLRALLKPGGLLLLGDLLPEDGGFHRGNNHDESAFHNGFDPKELQGLCEGLGLGVQRLLPFHIVRKPDAAGVVREYPLFFLAAKAV
jgi:SAM-dependent methyltransferase